MHCARTLGNLLALRVGCLRSPISLFVKKLTTKDRTNKDKTLENRYTIYLKSNCVKSVRFEKVMDDKHNKRSICLHFKLVELS